MRDARDDWWIIASAAVAVHGVDLGDPDDVDVLLSLDDAGRILPALGIDPRPGSDHPRFRSRILGSWAEPPIQVEFMADFECLVENAWLAMQPTTRHAVEVSGKTVYVPDRADLSRLLLSIGRPKDIRRARLLMR